MSTSVASSAQAHSGAVRSLVPARMDRLPWTRFHWLVVVGLGVSWILDGLEIQIVALVSGPLTDKGTLALTTGEVGFLGTGYLLGQVAGALFFGRLTDKLGRKKLFIVTLAIYLIGSGLGGFAFNYWSLLLCRFIAGTGIGGEYTAINSAIDELIPSKYRGRVDIAVNGTYWGGAAIGSALGLYLFSSHVPIDWGWRIGFFIGPVLGLIIIFVRRTIPESPRWLMTHGRTDEAERTVDEIEERVRAEGVDLAEVDESKALEVTESPRLGFIELTKIFFGTYPRRSILGFTMMVTQAFLYNAIFFSYALVLKVFYHVPAGSIPYYFFPFAIGNLLGPLLLGHLFDTVGRRKMIFGTYALSGTLLLISAYLFDQGTLSAVSQTIVWCVIFFFASAGASSAYLTVSEIFPLELRGQAISYFFAISQGVGGALAPSVFGHLIGGANNVHAHRGPLSLGYVFGAALMITGALVAWFCGVNAEGQSLEDVATPLSAAKPQAEAEAA
ncbi:MFS transporter [Jatrophihabitans sp.]|uniref:MFS transporter n=1 Tax=Jatrophihabitans sp. TaxID=1932789 RepID=UPI0030C6F614|nr:major facilitator superfamily 1 [Jatrophihabitans sp.]